MNDAGTCRPVPRRAWFGWRSAGGYHPNPFYNDAANTLPRGSHATVDGKLGDLERLVTDADRRARHRKSR